MAINVKDAPIEQLTAFWIEWGTEHQNAVRALLSGEAAVIPFMKGDFTEVTPTDGSEGTHVSINSLDGDVAGFALKRLDYRTNKSEDANG